MRPRTLGASGTHSKLGLGRVAAWSARISWAAMSFATATSPAATTTTTYGYDELGRVRSVNYNNTVNNTYTYDAANNRTQQSSALVADTTPPTAPGSIALSGLTQTSVNASWSAASDNIGVTSYQYRLNSASTWVNIGNFTSVGLTGLTAGTGYTLDVRASDAAGNTGPASSASFTTVASITISNRTVQTQYSGAGTASYSLTSGGVIMASQAKSPAITSVGNWLSPQTGMSGFEARATLNSSSPCAGSALGSWLNLGSTLTWTVTNSGTFMGSSASCAFKLEIRQASNPGVILGTAQIAVVAVNAP